MDNVFNKFSNPDADNFKEGGMLLVDKPLGWTSFDVVNKLRYSIRHLLGLKKYKVGHAGTLDPLATGLLLICFSKYTKKIEELTIQDKTYEGVIRLWCTTPSYDAECEVDCYYPQTKYSREELSLLANSFLGLSDQIPPIFSAIKKDGVAYYKMARKGVSMDIPSRKVHIHSFDLTDFSLPEVGFEVSCSKGTYIRSLAHDFGQKLGNGAYLSSLRRTKVGEYHVDNAWELDKLVNYINRQTTK